MARLFSTVTRVAQVRLQNAGRRLALRGSLIGVAVLAGLVCLGFGLAAATVALARRFGTLEALGIMAGGALALLLIILLALALELRRHRRLAVRRADLDRQLFQAAALSMLPSRAPSRPVAGLLLVALGALLVLARRGNEKPD